MDAITLIASVPAIVALVNLAKRLGLSDELALVASVGLGVVINTANFYLGANGGYQAAVEGLLLGLAAAGLYDVAKTAAPTVYAPVQVREASSQTAAPKLTAKPKPTK